jgi:hypothetical protein
MERDLHFILEIQIGTGEHCEELGHDRIIQRQQITEGGIGEQVQERWRGGVCCRRQEHLHP